GRLGRPAAKPRVLRGKPLPRQGRSPLEIQKQIRRAELDQRGEGWKRFAHGWAGQNICGAPSVPSQVALIRGFDVPAAPGEGQSSRGYRPSVEQDARDLGEA